MYLSCVPVIAPSPCRPLVHWTLTATAESDMDSLCVIACNSCHAPCSALDYGTSAFSNFDSGCSMARHRQKRDASRVTCYVLTLTASGLSTPPTTPTQSSSQPVFPQEAQPCAPSAEQLEATPRSRSLSTPPDTGQRLSLPSAKPPIPSPSPMPSYSTSHQVSLAANCYD